MIDILLATYNGSKYLRQQLDSILAQTYEGWRLIIRDDGSDDDTVQVVEQYVEKYPEKIRLIKDNDGRLGASMNFGRLMEYSTSEYIMFSDQDDVWLPEKVQKALDNIKKAEQVHPDTPLLVHTDLVVVDENMNKIADSSLKLQRLDPLIPGDLYKSMVSGLVSGNTVIMNKRARDVSLPIPEEAQMYDWWITINVAKYGKVIYSPESYILYRQHGFNRVGAKGRDAAYFRKMIFNFKGTINGYRKNYRMLKKLKFEISLPLLLRAKMTILWSRWVRQRSWA